MIRRIFLMLISEALWALTAEAAIGHTADFKESGIWYSINADGESLSVDWNGTLTFVGVGHGCYHGTVNIPQTVTHGDKTYTVTGIKDYTFYFCDVTTVILPSTIQSIGMETFRGSWITELVLPSSLRTLGSAVFAESQLQQISIPVGVKELPNFAFRGSMVTQVTLPNTVKRIGKECFYDSKIATITIPEGVEEIEERTFYNSKLSEVYLPTTLKRICDNAFSRTQLETILVPNSVDSIGVEAFSESKLTQIVLPTTLTSMGGYVFRDCTNLTYVSMNCPHLKAINNRTFLNCTALEQIGTIPDAVKTIGDEAFFNCTALKVINLNASSSLENIGARAFKNSGLFAISVPAATKTIGDEAFHFCNALESIAFAENSQMKSIGQRAFKNTPLKEAILPDGIETIGAHAFYECTSLTKVLIPKNLESIEPYTFWGCASLGTIQFTEPSSLKSIHDFAFKFCGSIKSVTLPEGLEEIGKSAFQAGYYYNEGLLTYVYIPSTVKTIGINAFSKEGKRDITIDLVSPIDSVGNSAFINAERININHYDSWIRLICNSEPFGKGNTYFPHIYINDKLLTDYVIPNDITSIRDYAFYWNKDIQSVVFPNELTTIGERAFVGCSSLYSITFGDSIKSLGLGAFAYCNNISETHITNYDGWINLILTSSHSSDESSSRFCWNWFPNITLNGEPLTNYVIPAECTTISGQCFLHNTQMVTLTLPNSLKTIGYDAFKGCTALKNVTFITPPEVIENDAFHGCSLETVDIGDLGKWCGVNFAGRPQSTGIYKNKVTSNPLCMMEKPKVIVGGKQLENLNIPSTVTAINSFAFLGCQRFLQVTIPNAVTSIGELAFGYCSDLTTLKFGKKPKLETIGGSSFCSTALNEVVLPDSVKNIESYAFASCKGLKRVVLSQKLQKIDVGAFGDCTALEDISLPDGLLTIESYAFQNCWALKSICIPPSLQLIGHYAFYSSGIERVDITDVAAWCNVLKCNFESLSFNNRHLYLNGELVTELTIPGNVTNVQPYSFCRNTDITTVTVSEGVKSIGESCFSGCNNISSVSMPMSIEKLGRYAFTTNGNAKINVSLNLANLNSYIKANTGDGFLLRLSPGYLINLYVNDELMTDIVIPEKTTTLTNTVFYGFNIQSATLPTTLESIGSNAFANCVNMNYLYSKSRIAPTSTTNGLELLNVKYIYVPEGSIENYKGKWSDNAAIIQEAPLTVSASSSTLSATCLSESIDAHKYVYDSNVPYIDLSEATLDESFTQEVLQSIADKGTIIFLPEGKDDIRGTNIVANRHTMKLILKDSTDFDAPYDFTADVLEHQRRFIASSTEAETMCLPYDLATLPQGMKAYQLTGQDSSGNAMFEEVETVEANKPYLVTTTKNIDVLSSTNIQVKATPTEMADTGSEAFEFYGTLSTISHEDAAEMEAYALGPERMWLSVYDADDEVTIPAGRAYLIPTDVAGISFGTVIKTSSQLEYAIGDVNGNNGVDIGDAVSIVNYLVGKASSTFVAKAADTNKNGQIDIGDAVTIVNLLVGKVESLSRKFYDETSEKEPQ